MRLNYELLAVVCFGQVDLACFCFPRWDTDLAAGGDGMRYVRGFDVAVLSGRDPGAVPSRYDEEIDIRLH